MTSREDWVRVNDLFHRALDHPAAERRTFLQEACGGDAALVDEVASLLDAHDEAAEFIEPPVLPTAAETLATEAFAGRTFGHYRIDRVLGEGGMGVVYLAEDTRLSRLVALKALPARYTQDAVSRDRLKREARAAAALSHPGIATVYALEEFDGHVFIAFEFVPGETLRAELRRGPLSLPVVVRTALDIARALAAAHDRGIIHRDLKPENVIRTPSGQIKILDFGLARFREPAAPDVTLTAVGSLMGTPAHMSPEQIRSASVDSRSDVFSFGVMLYELTSGVNPFAGADHAATIANVLEAQPPRLQPGAVPESDRPVLEKLEGIILGCLQRVPDARFQSAHDIVGALEHLGAPAGRVRQPWNHTRSADQPLGARSSPSQAMWWWKFHQAATSATYLALLVPLWWVHEWSPGPGGFLLFLAGLIASLVASLLRWHLWFVLGSYPDQLRLQRRSTGPLIAAADVTFAVVLLAAALIVLSDHNRLAAVLVGAVVAIVLSFAVIEPATARAAFDRWESPS